MVSSYVKVFELRKQQISGLRNTVIPRLTSDPANEFFG